MIYTVKALFEGVTSKPYDLTRQGGTVGVSHKMLISQVGQKSKHEIRVAGDFKPTCKVGEEITLEVDVNLELRRIDLVKILTKA